MNEQTETLRGSGQDSALSVRRLGDGEHPVLYVHGATFPSALSVAYRFEHYSWMDDLATNGFDAWAFDFVGFGGSERYAEMNADRAGLPLGRAQDAAMQIARVVAHIGAATGRVRVSIIAHSWGTIAAGLFAAMHPQRVEKLCLFGPIARRENATALDSHILGRWRLLTVAEQLARFVEDVPAGHPPVLFEPDLERWGSAFLASDRDAASRIPPSVKVPNGPVADINAAWSGNLAYRPEQLTAPLLIVRGEWDRMSNDADADWLLSQAASPVRNDVKIPKGTHLLHLERGRDGLFAAVREFLGSAT